MRWLVVSLAALVVSSSTLAAQQPGTPCSAPRSLGATTDSLKPDIAILARVHARELTFNSQPQMSLQIAGCPQVDTTLVVLRTNLPKPVQPGVTYRDVIVDFKLNLKFVDLECYVAGRGCPAVPRDTTTNR